MLIPTQREGNQLGETITFTVILKIPDGMIKPDRRFSVNTSLYNSSHKQGANILKM